MKVGAQLLLACVLLAAIKAAVTGLLVAAALGCMTCFLQRPRETLATIAVLAQPWRSLPIPASSSGQPAGSSLSRTLLVKIYADRLCGLAPTISAN